MKALTLHEPWASAIALGLKTIETRSWSTPYRGPLAIHAGVNRSRANELAFGGLMTVEEDERRFIAAGRAHFDHLPFGRIVAVVDVVGCESTQKLIADGRASAREQRWGDFRPGRYGWLLANLRFVMNGPEVRGYQGLWPLDGYDITALLSA